jgi:hypothetical protein
VQRRPALLQVALRLGIGARSLPRLGAALQVDVEQLAQVLGRPRLRRRALGELVPACPGIADDPAGLDARIPKRNPRDGAERHFAPAAVGLIPDDPAPGAALHPYREAGALVIPHVAVGLALGQPDAIDLRLSLEAHCHPLSGSSQEACPRFLSASYCTVVLTTVRWYGALRDCMARFIWCTEVQEAAPAQHF